ncbi:hypothetical protein BH23BAC1_BH23BAC1_22970 [soil metagenome]
MDSQQDVELREPVVYEIDIKHPRDEEIFQLAEKIQKAADSLDYNLYNPSLTIYYKNSILRLKEEKLTQYLKQDSADRAESVASLIQCFEILQTKLHDGKYLAENAVIVDEAYMEERLNPYTYTRMNVRIYEKLYNSYRDKLVPFFLLNLDPTKDCDSFILEIDNLKKLQVFMINSLETRNARELERRIRNSDSPSTIINKLEIPVS